jgi:hypothetical protein
MAHVHGAQAVATAAKVAEEAVCPLHAAEAAAKGGMAMGGMMEHGAGMAMGNMMHSGAGMAMAPMMKHGAKAAATGAAVTASAVAGHSLLRRIAMHPLVLFGAGLAVGYLIHQYREQIISQAEEAVD